MDFVPVPIQAINGYDILVWIVGISILRALSQTPLKRGNSKRGAIGADLNEYGEKRLGTGSNYIEGDGGRRVVHGTDVNTLYEGRFTRRAALLAKQKRDNADRVAAGCVSTCCRALRDTRHVITK